MYTNPFSRTHSHIRQVIDKFLHIHNEKNQQKMEKKSASSNCGTIATKLVKNSKMFVSHQTGSDDASAVEPINITICDLKIEGNEADINM
ncbi:hypothetical protein GWI33_004294 [Rhynchophorus ferrugineus]|uniref:Uncharacterized protein n=1 Tax=Rhynchophorus ferrugineus TaxID=354439 RepID=A0A834IN81_RHYFE|nr:hypothetical protein GWI33_004294 [Rhynchophorus ferrugineus]